MLNAGGKAKDDLSHFIRIENKKSKKKKTVASEVETEFSPSQKSEYSE